MKSTDNEPAAKFTIPAPVVRIISGIFFVIVAVWLGDSIYNNDLVLPDKYGRVAHFHGSAVWIGCWWWDRSFSRYIHGKGSRGVRIVFTDAGIYFYKIFLARIGAPPFLLPWENVKRIQEGNGIWGRYFVLEVEDSVGKFKLELPINIEQELLKLQKDNLIQK